MVNSEKESQHLIIDLLFDVFYNKNQCLLIIAYKLLRYYSDYKQIFDSDKLLIIIKIIIKEINLNSELKPEEFVMITKNILNNTDFESIVGCTLNIIVKKYVQNILKMTKRNVGQTNMNAFS